MLKVLPYTALRTLEAVVRLRGFGRAAEELNVTQSAVSQHIKSLEEWLGHQLLHRKRRLTEPTEAGAHLAEAVRSGFGLVETLCDNLRAAPNKRARGLRIAAPPGFAYLWLLPRLLHFDALYPNTPVSLLTDPESQDLRISEADALICYSAGGFPDMHAEMLLSEWLAPVCTPEIARHLKSPADLVNQVILEDVHNTPERPSNWDVWSKETGIPLPHFNNKRRFGQANMVIQAAVDGAGIAMGRSPLVKNLIAEKKLVRLFEETAPSQLSYWFVGRHEAMNVSAVKAFRDWLHEEGAKTVVSDVERIRQN